MINIFLSWSGETGYQIASKLRRVLPMMLQGTHVFMSDFDINKGDEWRKILNEALIGTRYGMFIITPEASNSAWMGYEFGIISTIHSSNRSQKINILPLLFEGLSYQVPTYLSEFQGIKFIEESWQETFFEIAQCIREESEETAIPRIQNLKYSFDCFWRLIYEDINNILKEYQSAKEDAENDSRNDLNELSRTNESILSIKELNTSFDKILGIEKKIDDLFDQFSDFQSRLTPSLTEAGILGIGRVDILPSTYPSNPLNAPLRRFKDIIAYIEKNDLLDDSTLKELMSVLDELVNACT